MLLVLMYITFYFLLMYPRFDILKEYEIVVCLHTMIHYPIICTLYDHVTIKKHRRSIYQEFVTNLSTNI